MTWDSYEELLCSSRAGADFIGGVVSIRRRSSGQRPSRMDGPSASAESGRGAVNPRGVKGK